MQRLADRFGRERVMDVLKDTPLERYATQLGFQVFLVPGVVPPSTGMQFDRGMEGMFITMVQELGTNSVKVKGKKNPKPNYCSVQAVSEPGCTCKYEYSGTWKHPLVQLPDPKCKVLSEANDWLHEGVEEKQYCFNEIVANLYHLQDEERIPWHSDKHERLGQETVIVSITTGSPGVMCFEPQDQSDFAYEFHGRNCGLAERKQCYRDAGVRCALPLNPGDIMLMTGTAQDHLQHKKAEGP